MNLFAIRKSTANIKQTAVVLFSVHTEKVEITLFSVPNPNPDPKPKRKANSNPSTDRK